MSLEEKNPQRQRQQRLFFHTPETLNSRSNLTSPDATSVQQENDKNRNLLSDQSERFGINHSSATPKDLPADARDIPPSVPRRNLASHDHSREKEERASIGFEAIGDVLDMRIRQMGRVGTGICFGRLLLQR
ncbi:hypothetical protein NL676_004395 [Syzygium grande]|nr:hypothetical protein NL676_004395 [Syzygium grande]